MRQLLWAAAGAALLAGATPALAQMDTSAHAYRAIDATATTPSYGGGGVAGDSAGGRGTNDGWFAGMATISPNDPTYSYTEPPHRGQPSAWELNGDDGGRGTSYPAILGHDTGM